MNNDLSKYDRVRSAILEEAEKSVIEKGLCSFRMSSLAELVGCSKKTLYGFFKSKEDIIAALFTKSVTDSIHHYEQIISQKHLSSREKILYILMYENIKCWNSSKGDLCINFLGVNPHIYEHAGQEIEGDINVVFMKIKTQVEDVWRSALRSGELNASKQEIQECIFHIRLVERGGIVVGQNRFLRQNGHNCRLRSIYNLLCSILDLLDWRLDTKCDSYDGMIQDVSCITGVSIGDDSLNCRTAYDTLNDTLDI
ncbi:TetR/AcrR family transcriptional regulator [Shewanella eurypsychrophilus]|uniref:TetR/AcrR family transcriptional regulator n=1 Tax=Shewanella eurypsychrophilus TaxID=2593656 RepID=A0ABX6VCL3_9GAMM|nr:MULTISPECIES: TetR/AcrR family transcriptional regulator [Shewanella]QFU24998.1 TetR family transcriptional regulator [Shewanella sp. YLB-09]QPG60174.1 TetR/AcrR family transcriptional regulator [Shewanella eurypsychrophilus]